MQKQQLTIQIWMVFVFGMCEEGQDLEEVMTNTRTKGFSSYVRARFVIGSYSLFEENQDRLFRKSPKDSSLDRSSLREDV